MKLAIVSIAIGKNFVNLSQVTFPIIEKYAKRIGADFIPITEQKVSITSPHWEKFQLFDYLEIYDRILYLDCDILIKEDADNLFEVVPYEKLGMFNEAPFTSNRGYSIEQGAHDYRIKDFTWDRCYYNSGVMVLSKDHRFMFKKPEREIFNFFEQTYLNLLIQSHSVPIHNLHYKYNRMSCIDGFNGEPRHASQFIHYAGINPDISVNIVNQDIKVIEESDGNYKKYIWISVEGGLGDQIQAEPTVRFLKEKLHPNDDIRITTHFPEIFSHIDVQVDKHNNGIWQGIDTMPYKKITLPSPEEPLWSFLSNMLSHTVDFASISVLQRILPDKDKQYILKYSEEAKNNIINLCKTHDFSKCVLVHAGYHWTNKSFPASYWEGIVNELIDNDLTPILIGKNEETRGVTRLNTKDGIINLVNMLSLEELFAIIDLCPALISNDSAPIHIAGAFDNHIILIPTCKHPDHLLPWRNGSKYYKAKALYKKLMSEEIPSSPTEIYTVLGDKLLGNWDNYLPSKEIVVKEITEIFTNRCEAW